jgi:hypothetical protein
MSVIGDIRVSLDAIGFEQQMCLFVFIASYPLAIGGLLEGRTRRIAGFAAAGSMVGFAAMTDPWIHGVLLVAFFVAAVGLFIVSVCALHQLQRWVWPPRLNMVPLQAELPLQMPDTPRERGRPRKLPLTGRAGTT